MDINFVNRLNTAVEFLKDNLSFKVGDFVLGVVDANTIFINVYSSYFFIENIPRIEAAQELNKMKNKFLLNMKDAKLFSDYVKNKKIEYNLVLDTGGSGVIICKEKNGVLEMFV